jgi:hypothetical protein
MAFMVPVVSLFSPAPKRELRFPGLAGGLREHGIITNMTLLTQSINSILGMVFLGSFALGAMLIMLKASDQDNPIAQAMAVQMALLEE